MNRDLKSSIDTIQSMKEKGVFENYIEYIEFPFYKNLFPRTRINFTFPMTILIGKNGSGKTSTLHALYGAPKNQSCSDFWFSTEVDPIDESGDKNRFFYGYKIDKHSSIQEVMKTRMKRGSDTKKEDPDYWETSRPLKKDGMLPLEDGKQRSAPINKDVIYLDFRAEVSAFDKVFNFSKGKLNERKQLLRDRSKYLNRLVHDEPMRFRGVADSVMGTVEELSEEEINTIGQILDKDYVSIKVAQHRLYKIDGTSFYVKTKINSRYSEANAGSGEIAVIQLVRKIHSAPDYALVLLDEPEVSIHPGAQEKLKIYLLDQIIKKKLQVVISTHSPILIDMMPNSAIKLFKTNPEGKFVVLEDVHYQEAFFDIEDKVLDKKLILCEDYVAKEIIDKTLKAMDKLQYFSVEYLSGGEKTLITKYVPAYTNRTFDNKIFLILDGDMYTGVKFNEDDLTVSQSKDPKYLCELVKKVYGTPIEVFSDGGKGGEREDQKIQQYLQYLRFHNTNVFYLPDLIPEMMLLNSNYVKTTYKDILAKYSEITNKNAKTILREITNFDFGDSDHEHLYSMVAILANKWSTENSISKEKLVKILEEIFKA